MSKTIFDLELHETLAVITEIPREDGTSFKRKFHVTRVSGGWIYKRVSNDDEAPVFVPYTEELKSSKYATDQDEVYV